MQITLVWFNQYVQDCYYRYFHSSLLHRLFANGIPIVFAESIVFFIMIDLMIEVLANKSFKHQEKFQTKV